MKIFKKLLFLICIAPTSAMFGMQLQDWHKEFINNDLNPNREQEQVVVQSLTLHEFKNMVDFGSKKTAIHVRHSKSIDNSAYESHLFNMKFVDLISVLPRKRKRREKAINDFHIFFKFNEVEDALEDTLRDQIKADFCEELSALTKENKQQKLTIEELTKQNKERGKKINDFHTFFDCDKTEDTADQMEVKFSEQLSTLTAAKPWRNTPIAYHLFDNIIKENEQQKLAIEELQKKLPDSMHNKTETEHSETANGENHNNSDTITRLNLQNEQQKNQIEDFTKKSCILLCTILCATAENKQKKLEIEKLAQEIEKLAKQNKDQAEKIKSFTTPASVRKSASAAEKQQHSWWQRNASRVGAAVMGGCMLLGAGLYSFFAK
jgi:hypothetical protein